MGQEAKKRALELFSAEKQAKAYYKAYKSLYDESNDIVLQTKI